jgi:hypothetical protein
VPPPGTQLHYNVHCLNVKGGRSSCEHKFLRDFTPISPELLITYGHVRCIPAVQTAPYFDRTLPLGRPKRDIWTILNRTTLSWRPTRRIDPDFAEGNLDEFMSASLLHCYLSTAYGMPIMPLLLFVV